MQHSEDPSSPVSSHHHHLHHPTPQSQLSSAFKRSDSFRSDQTDASSEARRVSFNSDVQIKKIPKRKSSLQQQPPLPPSNNNNSESANVRKEDPPTDAASIALEAERILKHLQGVKCRASPTPQQQQQQQQQQQRPLASSSLTPTRSASANTPSHLQSSNSVKTCNNSGVNSSNNNNSSEECDSGLQGASSSMQTATGGESLSSSSFGANESSSDSKNHNNRLFGLHALNNLDIAVNGKNVNSMPGYQEVRQQYLDSSGNSADYSPQPVKRNQVISNGTFISSPPNKPPRSKAPSASPPSVRRMAATAATPHYAQPERSTKMVSSMMEQLSQDSRFRRRLAETTDDDGMSGVTSSAYSTHNRNYLPPGAVDTRELSPSSRLSPSRTCMTDTELLRSPTEVLYAVSDKYRHPSEHHLTHSASQTAHSELQPAYHTYDRRAVRSSREDLLSDAPSSVRNRPSSHHANGMSSRSLDRYGHHSRGENKENAFKARIQVVSPDRAASPGGGGGGGTHRKPYKTTINTANDDIIQYHGHRNNHHHSADPYMSNSRRQIYQKNQTYRRPESEHYKVPKNKAPVEYLRNGAVRHPGLIMNSAVAATDSDHSSSVYHRGPYNNRGSRGARHPGEMDREGRTIRRDRVRAYSGCSTSPDRQGNPDARGSSRPRGRASWGGRGGGGE